MRYFYDTSAVYEFLTGNESVKSFFVEPNEGVVALPIVMEAYFTLLRDVDEGSADTALKMLYPLMVLPTKSMIRKAMKFRLENQSLGLSYADALGYIYAKEHKIPYLTADRAFRGLQNAVFVR